MGLADINYVYKINNKVLLYSIGKYIQYLIINNNGKESEKEHMYVCNVLCVLSHVGLFVTPWTILFRLLHGILQPRILEWVAMPSSRGSPDPGIEPASLMSPALAGRFFTTLPPGKPRVYICIHLNVTESLCYSPETQRSTILQ